VTLFLVGLGLILAGGVSSAFTRRFSGTTAGAVYQLLVGAGCAIAALDAARVLASGARVSAAMHATMPGGDWGIGIDALSAVFLLALLGVGAMCAFFGTSDLADERQAHGGDARRSTWFTQLAFAVLLVAIAVVVAARTVVVFLGAWEVMAIGSYVLIVTHHEDADVRRSGLIYLVATHTATLALFAMFAMWQAPASDWSFDALAAASPSLHTGAVATVLLLALVGFGFKAGVVPMHFWLPPAHASAPSHVSALMSGIVIKTGIYGLLRVLLLLGGAPAWWGWLVLGLGAASGVLGVLWALAQHDTKRLLAYHSVENIGIILMGIGVGALGVAHGAPTIAVLGFAGGLLHTVNHALFKSLLFLGAGAVYRATGTRNMEELGGLAKRMPLTWLGFAVGAAAIVGLPPFNGFVSEWLVYQGLFSTGESAKLLRLALLGIPALALIGALALACFAKVAGVVFLGAPRGTYAREATERGFGALAPVLALAAACVVLGVVPTLGISLVKTAAQQLSGLEGATFPETVISGAWVISLLALALLAMSAMLWAIRHALLRRQTVRHGATWSCAYDVVTPRMQYTASSFASPLLDVFGPLSGTRIQRSAASIHTHPIDLVLDGVALPLWGTLYRAALRMRAIQHGRLHFYLLYVLAALLVLLGYLSLWSRL
jgi:formate hydrogenlyase subunit 3/multisubunit Na+/H+ antiporter MnhD subunit